MTSQSTFTKYRLLWRAVFISAAAFLSGCLFESPYWAQTFATTTTPIPIQTWTVDKTHNVKIECSQAYHGGLQPAFGPEVWLPVTDIVPSTLPSYDTNGAAIYSAGVKLSLPAACWYADGAYSPPKYMSALRATQLTSSGSTTTYRVFDLTGLECVGRENGKAGSWFSWLSKNCAKTYSGSSTLLPWVKVIANGPGAAAMSRSLPASAAMQAFSAPTNTVTADSLNKRFQSEVTDLKWATPEQTRLRNSYDTVSPAGSMLLDLGCRSTLCRIEVSHVDGIAQERFVAALAPLGLFSNDGISGMVFHQGSKAELRSVYFIAREGHDLSVAPQR